jgi:hypothetical protein
MDTQDSPIRAAQRRRRTERFDRDMGLVFGEYSATYRRVGMHLYRLLEDILERTENVETQLAALESALAALEADDTVLTTAVAASGEELLKLTEALKGLEVGSPITQEQIDALTTRAQSVLKAQTSAVQALGEDVTKAQASSGESQTGGGEPPTPTKPLYKHTTNNAFGESWTLSEFRSVPGPDGEPGPQPLYEFSGDPAGTATANGAGPEWEVYTGPTEAAAS